MVPGALMVVRGCMPAPGFSKIMKAGDTVRHKLAGITMTVISISETVARCRKHVPTTIKTWGIETEVWGAVCLIENLEVIEPESVQLTIFK